MFMNREIEKMVPPNRTMLVLGKGGKMMAMVNAIYDSGASNAFADEEWMRSNGFIKEMMERPDVPVKSMAGMTIENRLMRNTNIWNQDGKLCMQDVIVMPHMKENTGYEVILGRPWGREMKVKVNWATNEVIYLEDSKLEVLTSVARNNEEEEGTNVEEVEEDFELSNETEDYRKMYHQKKEEYDAYELTHMPAIEGFDLCGMAKLKKKKHRSVKLEDKVEEDQNIKSNEHVGVDVVDISPMSRNEHRYVMTHFEYGSQWKKVFPLKHNNSHSTKNAFVKAHRGIGMPKTVRCDPGKKFQEEFEEILKLNLVHKNLGPTNRPDYHKRQERWHHDMNQMTRAALLSSGLSNEWWDLAVAHVVELDNRVAKRSFGKTKLTPYERLMKFDPGDRLSVMPKCRESFLVSFGVNVFFKPEKERIGKLSPGGELGIVVGANHENNSLLCIGWKCLQEGRSNVVSTQDFIVLKP